MLSAVLSLFQVLAILLLLAGLGFAIYVGLEAKQSKAKATPIYSRSD